MTTSEQRADKVIAGMVSAGLAGAVIPLPLAVPFMAVVAAGVVTIGACYGVRLTRAEAWKLVREFFRAAGITFMALNVGSVFISSIMVATGAGYPVSVALDAVQGSAIAYAVGTAAKHHFAGDAGRREIGEVMRRAFAEQRDRARSVIAERRP